MGNREERSRDEVLLSMVSPAVEAMKRNPPPLIDAEPSEPTPSRPARSSAVSSAAPSSLGPEPGMACRTCGRSLRPSRTGNGVAALVLDVACGILPQVPGSTRAALGGSIPLGGAAPSLVYYHVNTLALQGRLRKKPRGSRHFPCTTFWAAHQGNYCSGCSA